MKKSSAKKTGNKGEWGEFYAFLKILTDQKLFLADKDLNILKDNFFYVLKISREERGRLISYDISNNDGHVVISKDSGKASIVELDSLKKHVVEIFDTVAQAGGGTFAIPSAQVAMKSLQCTQIKASSGNKEDIRIILHDKKSPTFPEVGFSIKSRLGSPSTLLNASGTTNLVFSDEGIGKIRKEITDNSSDLPIREKIRSLYADGGSLMFEEMTNSIFKKNLRKIDSLLPQIIAEVVKAYYTQKNRV